MSSVILVVTLRIIRDESMMEIEGTDVEH